MKTVYQLIATVSSELCQEGISKDRTNAQGTGYKFRGIDDVYNAISPIISKHGLVIMPRILSREITERVSGAGKALFFVTVEAEFDFVSSHDGSKHTVKTFGEAMDSGDKATNKAMSAAYKYAAFQTFCIPTEGDNDADANSHSVAAKTKPEEKPKSKNDPLPGLSDEVFEKKSVVWKKNMVDKGETAENLIAFLQSKYSFTEDQIKTIKSWDEKHEAI